MEFEDVGDYCQYDLCGQHTYLPLECSSCKHKFCKLHINQSSHQCIASSHNKIPPPNPIELAQQQQQHQNSHNNQKTMNRNTGLSYYKCAFSKCHKESPISILCKDCDQLFCVQHRYPEDHQCGKDIANGIKYDEHGNEQINANFSDYDSDNDVVKQINHTQKPSDKHYENTNNINIEVINIYKFNEFRAFGYDDKAVHNAWYQLKMQQPSITPDHPQFTNKMLDILVRQQMNGWDDNFNFDHIKDDNDEDEKILSVDKQINIGYEHQQVMDKKEDAVLNEMDSFDIGRECALLHDEIGLFAKNKSKQNKIDAFIHLIDITNTTQRQEIKEYYKQKYLINLDHYIHMNFKGIFKRMLLYGMQTEIERKVYLLRMGIKKMNEINVITQILCILESESVQQLIELHDKGMFRKSFKSQIMKLTADNLKLRTFLMNIINGKREKSSAIKQNKLIKDDVIFLNKILNQIRWDKMEEIQLIDIFTKRSFSHLYDVCVVFKSLMNTSLIDAVSNSLGNQYGIGYAIYYMLTYLMDRNLFYNDLLTKSMKNGGHKHILFWRIIIDGIDMNLKDILASYGKSDVDRYNFKHFMNNTLHKEDAAAADLILKLCKF